MSKSRKLNQAKKGNEYEDMMARAALSRKVHQAIIDLIISSRSVNVEIGDVSRNLLEIISETLRKHLHSQWCHQTSGELVSRKTIASKNLPRTVDEFSNLLASNILIQPLKKIFKSLLSTNFSGSDDQIESSIKLIFKEFLQKDIIENTCVSLFNESETILQKRYEGLEYAMAGIYGQIGLDLYEGYKKLGMDLNEIGTICNNFLTTKIPAHLDKMIACDQVIPSRTNVALTEIRVSVICIAGMIYIANKCMNGFDFNYIDLIMLCAITIALTVHLRTLLKADRIEQDIHHQKETHSDLVLDLVSLQLVDSLERNLEDKNQIDEQKKPATRKVDKKEKPSPTQEWTDSSENANSCTPSCKRQKTITGKDKEKVREDDNKTKIQKLKQEIQLSLDKKYPSEAPTWFNGIHLDTLQFRHIDNSERGDYFYLLPQEFLMNGKKFNQYDEFSRKNITFDRQCLKELSINKKKKINNHNRFNVLECNYQGESFKLTVFGELKSTNTKDRILVGHVSPDNTSAQSLLFIGFYAVPAGFHTKRKLKDVITNLHKTSVNLDSLPAKRLERTNTV